MNEIILIGLVVSLIYTEIVGISPGGLIVPAYLVLYLETPQRIVTTLILSLVCVIIVKFISTRMIIYGRREFSIYIIVGILLQYLFTFVGWNGIMTIFNLSLAIGYLVPGILAKDISKQGGVLTLSSLLIVICTTKFLSVLFNI